MPLPRPRIRPGPALSAALRDHGDGSTLVEAGGAMNALAWVLVAGIGVVLVHVNSLRLRRKLGKPVTGARKRQLVREWQKSGGRDCGGWDPNHNDVRAWAQCDPKTLPPAVRRRLGAKIAKARRAA